MEQTQKEQSLIVLQKRLPMLVTMAVAIVLCCAVVMNFTRAWYSNNLDASAEGMQIISESPDVAYQLVIYRNGEQVYPLPEGSTINPWVGLLPGEEYVFFLEIKRTDTTNKEKIMLDIGFLGIEGYALGTTYSIIPEARTANEGAYINAGAQQIEIPGNTIQVTSGDITVDPETGVCTVTGSAPEITFNAATGTGTDIVKTMSAADFTIANYLSYNSDTKTFTFPEATIVFPEDENNTPIYEFTLANGEFEYVDNLKHYKIIPKENETHAVITLSDGTTYMSSEFIATGFSSEVDGDTTRFELQSGISVGSLTQTLGTVQAGTGSLSTDVFKIGYFGEKQASPTSPLVYYEPMVIETGLTENSPASGEFKSMTDLLNYFNSNQNTHVLNHDLTAGTFEKKGYYLFSHDWSLPEDAAGEVSIVIPFGIKIEKAEVYMNAQNKVINTPSDLSNISFTVEGIFINAVPAEPNSSN